MDQPTTISDIIERAGGAEKIAPACKLKKDAIYKWPGIGIPDRHWSKIIDLAEGKVTVQMLYEANRAARSKTEAA